jgi:hypothetical protein
MCLEHAYLKDSWLFIESLASVTNIMTNILRVLYIIIIYYLAQKIWHGLKVSTKKMKKF